VRKEAEVMQKANQRCSSRLKAKRLQVFDDETKKRAGQINCG
jgi:hypothetical protein